MPPMPPAPCDRWVDPIPAEAVDDPHTRDLYAVVVAGLTLCAGAAATLAAGASPWVVAAMLGTGASIQFATIVRFRTRLREVALERMRERVRERVRDRLRERAVELERVKLSEEQTLDATGRLAAKVGHEFNNLLAVIAGDATTLVEDRSADREVLAAALHASVRRGAVLTNQLLAFGRKHVVRPERLDLAAVVRHYQDLFRCSFPPGVRIELELDAGAFVMADRTEIEQILHALCVNASLAMPQGGRITLRVRLSPEGQSPTCVLEVEDNGAGMDEATQARLFQPFFSTRANGAGLGLVTTRTIVERYGGAVTVRSQSGEGTLVRVSLPRLTATLSKPTGARSSLPGGGRTVLVVDDEPLVRRSLVRPLERAQFIVREAEDGLAALEVIKHDPSICVVVSDVLMPGMDGITLARHLQSQQIPVILVSGYADIVSNDNQLGVPMLAKPFSARELVTLVRREALASMAATKGVAANG